MFYHVFIQVYFWKIKILFFFNCFFKIKYVSIFIVFDEAYIGVE